MTNQPMKYLIPRRPSSAINKNKDTLKRFRAMTFGRNMSVIVPFSAPYFSAREVSGHRPLLRSITIPSIKIVINAKSKTQLNILVMPL